MYLKITYPLLNQECPLNYSPSKILYVKDHYKFNKELQQTTAN